VVPISTSATAAVMIALVSITPTVTSVVIPIEQNRPGSDDTQREHSEPAQDRPPPTPETLPSVHDSAAISCSSSSSTQRGF
jgi:hypothetical protein